MSVFAHRRRACLRCSFCFHCARPPRDLHSFPTRRSSDLLHPFEPNCRMARILARLYYLDARAPTFRDAASGVLSESRSEEHTSELQSHSDIVCRLLLEKKNSINVIGVLY